MDGGWIGAWGEAQGEGAGSLASVHGFLPLHACLFSCPFHVLLPPKMLHAGEGYGDKGRPGAGGGGGEGGTPGSRTGKGLAGKNSTPFQTRWGCLEWAAREHGLPPTLPIELEYNGAVDSGKTQRPDPAESDAAEYAGLEVQDEDLGSGGGGEQKSLFSDTLPLSDLLIFLTDLP